MPRFYFNVHDGASEADRRGMNLLDVHMARLEAVAQTGRILLEQAEHIADLPDWFMEVTDEAGAIVFRLDVRFADAPAVLWKGFS